MVGQRTSLVEQYNNKDVISQIYNLKDEVGGYSDDIEKAVQDSNTAYTEAQQAKKLAQDAITQSGTFDARITQAQNDAELALSQAEEAQTDADSAVSTTEIRTTKAEGTLWMKQVNNVEKTTNIPIANEYQAGIMNVQMYQSLQTLGERVSALEGQNTVAYVTFPSDDPTQSEITNAFQNASGRPPVAGDIANDIARALVYQYNGTLWIKTKSTTGPWSNTSSGTVKGTPASGADGTLFAESDGTGSVNGWDALKTRVSNCESNITSNTQNISVNANAIATANTNISKNTTDIATNTAKISEVDNAKQVKLKTASVVLSVAGWSGGLTQSVQCGIVTANNIVWVAPADNVEAYGTAGVYASAQGGGTLTFVCKETPTVAFTVSVVTADI